MIPLLCMTMALKHAYTPRYTAKDYERWEGQWELIDGHPCSMNPGPLTRHQAVSRRLNTLLAEALADCPACEPFLPVNYRVSDETILQPDNLVVCSEEPLEDDLYLTTTPVLIFEILSPSTAHKDRLIEREIYEAEGVRHYVLVDPDREEVEVLTLGGGHYESRFTGREGTVAFDHGLCTATLDVARLWRR